MTLRWFPFVLRVLLNIDPPDTGLTALGTSFSFIIKRVTPPNAHIVIGRLCKWIRGRVILGIKIIHLVIYNTIKKTNGMKTLASTSMPGDVRDSVNPVSGHQDLMKIYFYPSIIQRRSSPTQTMLMACSIKESAPSRRDAFSWPQGHYEYSCTYVALPAQLHSFHQSHPQVIQTSLSLDATR